MQPAIYRRLSELIDRHRVEKNVNRVTWVRRLFGALDWGDRAAFTLKLEEDTELLQLQVESTTVITVVPKSPDDIEKVYHAINRAYNQDVPWVVATDFRSLALFGSYWMSYQHDIKNALAWQIEGAEFLLESPKLNLLTP